MDNSRRQLSAESQTQFGEGLYLVLSRWSALRMAVENEWAGRGSRQLADQLGSNIFSWFTTSKEPLYIDDLENILDEGMSSLNTDVDDGSIEEVAEKLMIMHEECLDGNYNAIEELRKAGQAPASHQHVRQVMEDDDDDSDEEEEDDNAMLVDAANTSVNAQSVQPRSDKVNTSAGEPANREAHVEDGWEVVSSRRNKGRRH